MSIVTFSYLFFVAITLIIYYAFPRKHKWVVLLAASITYFLSISNFKYIGYLIFAIGSTYIGTRCIEKLKDKKNKKLALIITLFTIIFLLFLLKYFNLINITLHLFSLILRFKVSYIDLKLIAPLGISYYSLSLIGYVIDVYRGAYQAEKNIFKHALFSCYFPVMLSGPIIRYNEMKDELFNTKKIEWKNIYQGATRIIYGLMKKLVVADFFALFVRQIFTDYHTYSGPFIIIGVICYALQIYNDFSGCMDIVLGTSKMFDVKLPENFTSPFYSKTLPEFWRRWHITLGTWSKDYIMYPLLKSDLFQKFGKYTKKKFGKKVGKKIPTILSILILWIIIGIWHGATIQYIVAAGIIPWIYLTTGEIFNPLIKKISSKMDIDNFSFKVFQIIRTFLLMCLLWLFVCVPSLKDMPNLFINIFKLPDFNLITQLPIITNQFLLLLIFIGFIDYLIYNDKDPLEMFYKQNIIFKWIVIFIVIYMILIYGQYGPGYSAASFIYGGF